MRGVIALNLILCGLVVSQDVQFLDQLSPISVFSDDAYDFIGPSKQVFDSEELSQYVQLYE